MEHLAWTEDFAVGVDFMDEDHKHVIELINRLAETSGEERLATFRQFRQHCEEHFAREEEMMRAVQFFAYAMHKGEHDRVLAELADVELALTSGAEASLEDYFKTGLADWLVNHRNTMDLVTANHFLQAGP